MHFDTVYSVDEAVFYFSSLVFLMILKWQTQSISRFVVKIQSAKLAPLSPKPPEHLS